MSQYKDGTASVFNNSNIVTGSGTLWLASISAGDLFTKAGDDVAYTVAGVTNNTILTLTAPYGGSSSSGSNYGITIGFTAGGLPLLSAGDLNTAAIYNEAMKNIDNYNLSNLGTAAYADLTATKYDQTQGRAMTLGAQGFGTYDFSSILSSQINDIDGSLNWSSFPGSIDPFVSDNGVALHIPYRPSGLFGAPNSYGTDLFFENNSLTPSFKIRNWFQGTYRDFVEVWAYGQYNS